MVEISVGPVRFSRDLYSNEDCMVLNKKPSIKRLKPNVEHVEHVIRKTTSANTNGHKLSPLFVLVV